MEVVSLKQYASDHRISYEAVRRQVVRYSEELSGHISIQNRTQYLDEWAVNFLNDKRRESPIISVNETQFEENQLLREEIESLRAKLLTIQDELLKRNNEWMNDKNRIIELQDEARKTIEDRAKYTALLEDNKAKEAKLQEVTDQIEDLRKEREKDQQTIADQDDQILKIQQEAEDLRRQAEEDVKMIDKIRRERDAAQMEAQSFTKSIFGLYRKK